MDTYSLLLASPECPDFAKEQLMINVTDPWAQEWIKEEEAGQAWAERMNFSKENLFFVPRESCAQDSPRPLVGFNAPAEGALITSSPLAIFGMAGATDEFQDWILEYGIGNDPVTFPDVIRSETEFKQPDKLLDWDLSDIPNGPLMLKLTVRGKNGGKATVSLRVSVGLPTPTPTATASPTPTDTPTNTPTPTLTPSLTPVPSDTPSP